MNSATHNSGSAPVGWLRLGWAALATVAFGIPVVWTLLSPVAPHVVETPIAKAPETLDGTDIPFAEPVPVGDERVYTMWLFSPAPHEVLTHPKIRLLFFQSDKTSPHPSTGRIEVIGTQCAYETAPGVHIGTREVEFSRVGNCRLEAGRPNGDLKLTIRMGGPGDLGIYVRVLPEAELGPGLIYIARTDPESTAPMPTVVGHFVDYMPDGGLGRAHLLSYMWTGNVNPGPVWWAVALSALLFFIGTSVFPTNERRPDTTNWARTVAPRTTAGAFCFATALALLYAVFIPPLHAADETPFTQAYSVISKQPAFLSGIKDLAKATHFERIRFYQDEHFRPRDVGSPFPYVVPFDVLEMEIRSSLTTRLWTFLGHTLPPLRASYTFGLIRGVHALLFGIAVALAAGFLAISCRVPYPQLLCFPFLFIPTLPFFGMQFSETAILTSASVLFAASLIPLLLDGDSKHYTGLPIGLAFGAVIMSTRSALPMAALMGVLLAARVILGSEEASRHQRNAAVFWGGIAVAAAVSFSAVSLPHLVRILETASLVSLQLPKSWRPPDALLLNPWPAVVVVAPALGWALEVSVTRARLSVGRWLQPASTIGVPLVCYTATGAIALSLAGSWWWDYPDVENIQSPLRPGRLEYVRQVVLGVTTMFRLRKSSTFLSDSFWAGFGWLDTMPGDTFVAILLVLTAAALVIVLLQIARSGDARRLAWLIAFAVGSVAAVAFYALSSYQIVSNLHGRYLMSWYVAAVATFWMSTGLRTTSEPATSGTRRAALLLAVVLSVHTYSLCFILQRYF